MKVLERRLWKRRYLCNISRETRDIVMTRDRRMCQMCDSKQGLTIHHLVPINEGGESNVENLIVLCDDCHDIVEEEGLRDPILIKNWPNHNDKPIVEETDIESKCSDWHEWVYGGARNPMKDLSWP